jgi:8-oxo-dGTP pyrophosphatase MutT (NUDIX family)
MSQETSEKLEKLLAARDPHKLTIDGDFVHAAVMMILKEEQKGSSLLFIKRPDSDSDPFSGHVAFPGGKMKGEDSDKLETAVRETREEIGVDITHSGRVIGELDDVNPNNPRANTYIVTPYLSVLEEEVTFTPCAREVEEVLWVPVNHLLDEKNFKLRLTQRDGKLREDYAYIYEQYIIWGMTGRILRQFFTLTGHLF